MSFPLYTLVHQPSELAVARITRLDGWWAKGVGVIGMRTLPQGEGVWLPGVSAVHTLFVRFPLDLLFLDADLKTVAVLPDFPPWRPLAWGHGAKNTIELGTGTVAALCPNLKKGDSWLLQSRRF